MILLTPNSPLCRYDDKKMIFLAGPLSEKQDWRKMAETEFANMDVYVVNPVYKERDSLDYKAQVNFETYYFARADVIMFWLNNTQSSALITRFELGEWLGKTNFNQTDKKIVLGIEKGFKGEKYIRFRCQKAKMPIENSLEQTILKVKDIIKNLKQKINNKEEQEK